MKDMIRIANTDIPGKNTLHIGLTHIHGISYTLAHALCTHLGLDKHQKIGDLTDDTVKHLETLLKDPTPLPNFLYNRRHDRDTGKHLHLTGAQLKLRTEFDIRHMKTIKSYKGIRHALGQPVRGQRTKSHFRKGATVGVMKKAAKLLAAKKTETTKKEDKK